MNLRTQTQLLNAIAANKGPRVWSVMVSFGDTSNTYAVARNVTHREAKALARASNVQDVGIEIFLEGACTSAESAL